MSRADRRKRLERQELKQRQRQKSESSDEKTDHSELRSRVSEGEGFFMAVPSRGFALILIGLPLLIYWQSLSFDFVWDDIDTHLLKHPDLDSFGNIWKKSYSHLYIPVSYTVWGLLKGVSHYFFGSLNPLVFHLANIIVHILNGFLVFSLLSIFVKNRWAILSGVLLFLVHPIQVQSVVWISEFRGLLSTGFGLSALLTHLHTRTKERTQGGIHRLSYGGSLVLFILALLSKPSAVSFLIYVFILDIFLFRDSFKRTALKFLPWFSAVLFIGVVTVSVQSSPQSLVSLPLWTRPFIWMDSINFYLYRLLDPTHLGACYGRIPERVLTDAWAYAAGLIPVLIGIYLWRLRRSNPEWGISFLLFVVGFLPVSGLITFIFQDWSTVSDRYLYLPMTGVALAFAYGISCVERKWFRLLPVLVLLAWSFYSFSAQVPIWRDTLSLWSHSIELKFPCFQAYNNRGKVLNDKKTVQGSSKGF